MRKGLPILFPLLFTTIIAFSQKTIKGKVVDASTGAGVPGCSVFVNNTSHGTATDQNGYFELNDLPEGKHELIVSSIGYETNAYPFTSGELPLLLKVEFQKKIKELQNVTVQTYEEQGWDRWGKLFADRFIGMTPNSGHCTIKNKDVIKFRFYKKTNTLIALADEPIIVENEALGYKISYKLEEFQSDFNSGVTSYFGYPFFEDMDTAARKMQKWKGSRDEAFYGSLMHFMRSLYKDSLAQQGFEVRRMFRVPNREKIRVSEMFKSRGWFGHFSFREIEDKMAAEAKKTGQPKMPKDSLKYYERVFRQPDYEEIYAKDLLGADSLILREEGANKILYFTDYLFVTYKKELEDEEYLSFHHENRNPTFQRSYITMPEPKPLEIDINGNYPPYDILAIAYWGWSQNIADFLPLDYEP